MSMTTNKQALREKFEAWWEVNYHNGNPPRFGWEHWRDGDGYKIDDDESELDGMWESWQAAHSSKLEAAEKRIAELEVRAFNPALLDVISERQRQRAIEGWTSEHDDAYQNSELADAAACYAIHAHNQGFSTPAHWPWSPDWWKQSGTRRDLITAGALILAEIERLDRAAGITTKGE
jgi:hypothetical protein